MKDNPNCFIIKIKLLFHTILIVPTLVENSDSKMTLFLSKYKFPTSSKDRRYRKTNKENLQTGGLYVQNVNISYQDYFTDFKCVTINS